MTSRAAVIDVGPLPNLVQKSRGSLWWGMVLLLVIEATVFGTLVASYFYLRLGTPEWPPPGVEPPKLLLPTLNTLVLLASSVPMYLADTGMAQGRQRRLLWGAAGAITLAVVFLVLKVIEYSDVPYRWDDHAYGSIVWLIIGFHSAHVASVVLKTIVVWILGYRGYFTRDRVLGVQINGLYWHFVVLVWLPLYAVLYWSPRLLH
ncbi:MAG TPA: cytochrome c oxidase subunit 3 [Vicinamibacterales bacterium]|nr:cytochrome c oxidase subunit 3 [Vicinamibacterales bacterium]